MRQSNAADPNGVQRGIDNGKRAKVVPVPTAANAISKAFNNVRHLTARPSNPSHLNSSFFRMSSRRAVSEHAHLSACEQAGGTLCFCMIISTRSFGPTRKLCPFTPKAGVNGDPESACSLTDLRMTIFGVEWNFARFTSSLPTANGGTGFTGIDLLE